MASKGSRLYKIEESLTLLVADIIFLELLLRLSTDQKLFTKGLAGGLFTAVALALLLGAVCCAFKKPKTAWIVAIIFSAVLTVWFIFCCLTYDAYKVYMPPNIILSQGGNAAKDFGGYIVNSIVRSLPLILLFFAPIILALVIPLFKKQVANTRKPAHLSEKTKTKLNFHLLLVAACILSFFTGRFLSTCTEGLKHQYSRAYTYDSAIKNYGAISALVQSIENYAAGAEDSFLSQSTNEEEENIITPVSLPKSDASEEDNAEQLPEENPVSTQAVPFLDETEPLASVPERVFADNVMDIDFSALAESSSKFTSIDQYVQSVQPSKKNEYTGMFEGKNLILITAEAFSKEVIDPERTPTLYRMASKGIVFEDFYQPSWGGSTSTGEFSFLTGLIPMDAMVMMSSRNANMYFTMGNQLKRLGYNSFAYHNGSYTYYSRHLTLPNMGYDSFTGIGNGMEKGLTGGLFPESDKEMMDYTVPLYIQQQPFSVYYMTISGHASYGFKDSLNDMCVKNQAVTDGLPYSEPVRAYLACSQELEYAMESLLGQLEEAGIADDTVIAIVSDHYPYGLLPSNAWGGQQGLLDELYGFHPQDCRSRDHNAAIIWCKELEEREPIVVSKPVSSIDILPTLSNLFGLEYDSRLLAGQDALSDKEGIVIWNDGCFLTEKGYFDAHLQSFSPVQGASVDESYVEATQFMVSDRLTMSRTIEQQNYYGYLFGK